MTIFSKERLWAPVVWHKDEETMGLFRSRQPWNGVIVNTLHDRMDETEAPEGIKKYLEDTLCQIDNGGMQNYFIDWPQNIIEEWAVEFNDSFTIKFDIDYKVNTTLQTQLNIRAYGNTNRHWIEYDKAYQEAYTMMKLESNLWL